MILSKIFYDNANYTSIFMPILIDEEDLEYALETTTLNGYEFPHAINLSVTHFVNNYGVITVYLQ